LANSNWWDRPSPVRRFGQPEIEDLHRAVRLRFDVGRLQVAVDDPVSCAASKAAAFGGRSATLVGGSGRKQSAPRRRPVDEFQRAYTVAGFSRASSIPCIAPMFGWFNDASTCFPFEARKTVRIGGKQFRHLERDGTTRRVSRARWPSPYHLHQSQIRFREPRREPHRGLRHLHVTPPSVPAPACQKATPGTFSIVIPLLVGVPHRRHTFAQECPDQWLTLERLVEEPIG
jgi:hypothetical protein